MVQGAQAQTEAMRLEGRRGRWQQRHDLEVRVKARVRVRVRVRVGVKCRVALYFA